MEEINKERAPEKTKNFIVDSLKKSRPTKKWKEVVEKNILAGGLKRINLCPGSLFVETWLQKPIHSCC